MASDAHAHPFDLAGRFPAAEEERRLLGIAVAASAWNAEQFAYHEGLAGEACRDGAAPLGPCFAVHPQLPAADPHENLAELLGLLEALAAEGRLGAVGETGFDLYHTAGRRAGEAVIDYRPTGAAQEELFAAHLDCARRYALPLVLHVRRAMHKVFVYIRELEKLPVVVFHSYMGTLGEAESLLRRGVNAYFSFGAPLLLNHKEAVRAFSSLPAERLLLETDAPYQPLRGRPFSTWSTLPLVLEGAAACRREAGATGGGAAELEAITDKNFREVYLGRRRDFVLPESDMPEKPTMREKTIHEIDKS
jgi:TatD DNase family protein